MKKSITLIYVFSLSFALFSQKEDSVFIRKIFDEALVNGKSYSELYSLCKDVGARLSGSQQADKAVEWSKVLFEKYQFDKVWLMPIKVPHWDRGTIEEVGFVSEKNNELTIKLSIEKKLDAKSLGGSVGTNGKLEGEVIEVQNFEELAVLGKKVIKGKIVFFNRAMEPRHIETGKAYGGCVNQRWEGAMQAAKYGAIGVIVRSATLKKDHNAHTGSMGYNDSIPKIPAIAISLLSADELSQKIKENPKQKIYINMDCKTMPDKDSYNVIGELTGSLNPDKYIVAGGHLDSWDVGEGAHDDGAGVMHAFEAVRILRDIGYKPKHTLRVVFYMNEENGNNGGKTYGAISKENNWNHIAAIESDMGGFVPRGFSIDALDNTVQKIQSWQTLLKPYNLHYFEKGWGGVDIGPLKNQGVPLIGLKVDSQRYFDLHHTDDDVFENVHQRELELGCGSVAALIYLIDKYGLE